MTRIAVILSACRASDDFITLNKKKCLVLFTTLTKTKGTPFVFVMNAYEWSYGNVNKLETPKY